MLVFLAPTELETHDDDGGLEIEAVFQSLEPSFDAPLLTSPSG
jgi:hypothetical protein